MKFFDGKSRLAFKLHKKKCTAGSDIDIVDVCEHLHNSRIVDDDHQKKILKELNKFSSINEIQDNKLFK